MRRILAALLALAATLAFAQPKEGELATFANRDTKDVQQRLQLMTHTLYAQQQQVITILFRDEYRDRVKMKLVWLPAKDNTLVPAWIFTPAKMDPARKYPGLVMVHVVVGQGRLRPCHAGFRAACGSRARAARRA